jgi:hypothetical protein
MKQLSRIFRLADMIRTFRYDRARARVVRSYPGVVVAGRRYAVLVAYQPDGISESLIQTCTHLMRESFSVVLVSNARLSEPDCRLLQRLCHVVIERPNVGHDFGAYKEGMIYLKPYLAGAERLLLLNDSIIYPVAQPDTLVPALERLGVDAASAAYVRESRKYRPRFRERLPTLASFFLYFRPQAFRSKKFQMFWDQYLLTGSKPAVIRYGEHALTACLRGLGLSVGAVCTKESVRRVMNQVSLQDIFPVLPIEFLDALATAEGVDWDPAKPENGIRGISDGDLLSALDRFIDERSVVETAAGICVSYLSANFIKKVNVKSSI